MINKTTAKATLTQMLNYTFQKMEVEDKKLRMEKNVSLSDLINGQVSLSKSDIEVRMIKDVLETEKELPGKLCMYDSVVNYLNIFTKIEDSALIAGSFAKRKGSMISLEDLSPWPSQFHRDVYIVFEKLCRLSSKTPADAATLASKILALELLLSVCYNVSF